MIREYRASVYACNQKELTYFLDNKLGIFLAYNIRKSVQGVYSKS